MDLNSLKCFSLLDTVDLIGWECILGMPNHRASPWSLSANGRRKMVSVVSLSPREEETYCQDSWHEYGKSWTDAIIVRVAEI